MMRSRFPDDEDWAVHEVDGNTIWRYSDDGLYRRNIDIIPAVWEFVAK